MVRDPSLTSTPQLEFGSCTPMPRKLMKDSVSMTTGTVSVLVAQPGGKVLVGGNFSRVNGVARNHFVRLTATGALDDTFAPVVDDAVGAAAVQGDGRIVNAGSFTKVGGVARRSVARLQSDGLLDPSFELRTPDAFGSGSSVRATSATSQPSAASACAIARPMPRDAPVTSATFPASWKSISPS